MVRYTRLCIIFVFVPAKLWTQTLATMGTDSSKPRKKESSSSAKTARSNTGASAAEFNNNDAYSQRRLKKHENENGKIASNKGYGVLMEDTRHVGGYRMRIVNSNLLK